MKGIAPEIEASVKAHFSPSETEQVICMFAELKSPGLEPEFSTLRARVQIGVLMLTKGNLESLAKAIRQSQVDWRDTLVSSGLTDLNTWVMVAATAGFKAPAFAT